MISSDSQDCVAYTDAQTAALTVELWEVRGWTPPRMPSLD